MLSTVEIETPGRARAAVRPLELDPWPELEGRTLAKAVLQPHRDLLRRYLNVAVAAVGLIVALPIMLVIAVAIKLSSPGPVLFTQTRVGIDRRSPFQESMNWRRKVDYGGKPFTLYKFRTMDYRPPEERRQVWALRDDPRVFSLGRILRKYRLDELPQLFNVVKGDMNIVGPRPEQPAIFADLRSQVSHYPQRQRVLPGITGLAQVNQQYDTCVEDVKRKVHYDLQYIDRQSALEDLRIMLRTVPAVLLKSGGW